MEVSNSGLYILEYTPGLWFFVHSVYSYVLVTVGTAWIIIRAWHVRDDHYFRNQLLTILVSVVVVMGANMAYNFDLTTIDWTPVAGGVWAGISGVAARKYRLFDLTPVARNIVIGEMDTGMIVVNPEYEVIDANESVSEILNIDPREIATGKQIESIFPAVVDEIESVTESQQSVKCVVQDEDADKYYDVRISLIPSPTGGYLGYGITFAEATTRVKQRNELQAKTDELQTKNERLEQFTGFVSHDLRNPLSVAKGRAQILDNELDDEYRVHLDELLYGINQMEMLIDDLLELAKAGETVDNPGAINLKTVAIEARDNIELEDSSVEVESEIDTRIIADADRLRQVFENLYRNADTHNSEPITVTVGLIDADDNNDSGSGFYVSDNGEGIAENDKSDIFDHGYTNSDDGTGFGLSIVKDIVEAHGWNIDVVDSDEGGARFDVTGVEYTDE
jgi:signal transduction histidine kinase